MTEFFIFCRACIAFVALFGFLFGQLFTGHFEALATVIGVSGLGMAALGIGKTKLPKALATGLVVLGLITLAGVAIDVYEYYATTPSYSGTYYPWILVGPFVVAVLILLGHAVSQFRRGNG